MRFKNASQFADEQLLGLHHHHVCEEALRLPVEARQEEPPTQLAREDRDQRIEVALAHESDELIETIEMSRADPFRVELEKRPDQQNPQVIGAQLGDGVQIPLDRVGIPVIPAEPPVPRRRVVDAETVTQRIESAGRSRVYSRECACERAARRRQCGSCGCTCRDEFTSVQSVFLATTKPISILNGRSAPSIFSDVKPLPLLPFAKSLNPNTRLALPICI